MNLSYQTITSRKISIEISLVESRYDDEPKKRTSYNIEISDKNSSCHLSLTNPDNVQRPTAAVLDDFLTTAVSQLRNCRP